MKAFYIGTGTLFLVLGIIGLLLPGIPTTPFLILTALCYSKGSKRMHAWLLSTPAFGKVIGDWERSGVIRLPAKVFATLMILISGATTFYFFKLSPFVILSLVGIFLGVLFFIWTRPSTPPDRDNFYNP